jgi:chemotaxis protein CheX
MQFEEEMLQQITIDVCQSMLGLELIPLNPPIDTARQLVASVEIRGTRHSIVEVFGHDHLMASIAEAMFASDRGSLSEDEIRDAFCEIANMIGGNVKGTYGEEADLTLPVIGSANDSLEQLPDGSLRTTFECCGYPLTIVLREVQSKPEIVEEAVALV